MFFHILPISIRICLGESQFTLRTGDEKVPVHKSAGIGN